MFLACSVDADVLNTVKTCALASVEYHHTSKAKPAAQVFKNLYGHSFSLSVALEGGKKSNNEMHNLHPQKI